MITLKEIKIGISFCLSLTYLTGCSSLGNSSNLSISPTVVAQTVPSDLTSIAKIDESKLPGGDSKLIRLHDGFADVSDGIKSGKYWMFEAEQQSDFSKFKINLAIPLYMIVNRKGQKVGQNVIDMIPSDPGYSPYWQIHKISVPDDYVANTFRSANEVRSMLAKDTRFKETIMEVAVNCPIVAQNAKLEGAESKKPELCWYKEKRTYYFAFDTLKIKSNGTVPVAPIWIVLPEDGKNAKETGLNFSSYDKSKANPMPFLNQDLGEGKTELVNNIIDTFPNPLISTPDNPEKNNYSGLWLVFSYKVGNSYEFRSKTKKIDFSNSKAESMNMLVNCPLLETLQ